MRFIFLLIAAGVAANVLRWLLGRRTDLAPPSSPPRYRVAISIGWSARLARSTPLAAPFAGLMGGFFAILPALLLVSEVFRITPAQERPILPPLFLTCIVGGIIGGVWVGRRARRAELPHLEVFDDRVVVPAPGPLDVAIRIIIPFSELASVNAVKDDLLVIAGRHDSAVVRANDIASMASVPGIQAEIESAVRESADGGEVARRLAEEALAIEGFAERPATVTTVIEIALIAVYVLQWFAGSPTKWTQTLVRMGANFQDSWSQGHAYRLVAANYLHANLIHLVSNLGAIAGFGLVLEKLIGSARMILIYGVSALAGAFTSSFTDSLAVGASTGVFGLMAASAAVQWRHGSRIPNAFQINAGSWIVLVVVNGALPLLIPNISWAGHAGGALAGLAVAAMVTASPTSIDGHDAGTGVRVAATGLIVLHAIGLMVAAWFFLRPSDFPAIPVRAPR